jgi:molybdopterin biosynthesis enzyme
VSVLVTGDELVDVWDVPSRGRIRNSNGYAVMAQAASAGAVVRSLGVVPDQADRIADAVREGFASDVLVHAVTSFGIGGLLGGLAMTWWHRRGVRRAASAA